MRSMSEERIARVSACLHGYGESGAGDESHRRWIRDRLEIVEWWGVRPG